MIPSQLSVAPDLAKALGYNGLHSLFEVMCNAYFDLLRSGFVQEDTPENIITEEWFIKIQIHFKKAAHIAVIPVHQKEDTTMGKRGKISPTIDFCFRAEYFPKSYFGAECKLMDEGNRRHLREYVNENGLGRFLNCSYAMHSSAGAMVGYVRLGDPKVVAKDVQTRISKISGNPKMNKTNAIGIFEDIYESDHTRTCGVSPFLIFHLFYAFGEF